MSSKISQKRLVSLDVLRGLTIASMILVNTPYGQTYPLLLHPDWNGLSMADLVFPSFLFILGVSICYSSRLRANPIKTITKRFVLLYLLGLFLNFFTNVAYGSGNLGGFRFDGVLQRVAICYAVCSLLHLYMSKRWNLILVCTIMIIYWPLVTVLNPSHSIDPESLLSTFSALATTLLGVLTGQYILDRDFRMKVLIEYGLIAVAVGSVWNLGFPVNKHIWSSSYVALMCGLDLLIFTTVYYITDIKKKQWLSFFKVLGVNSIFIYLFSEFVNGALWKWTKIEPYIYSFWTQIVYGSENASLMYALSFTLFCWLVALGLYKKKIFIRV